MQTITFYHNNKALWRAGLHSGHGRVPEEGAREQKQEVMEKESHEKVEEQNISSQGNSKGTGPEEGMSLPGMCEERGRTAGPGHRVGLTGHSQDFVKPPCIPRVGEAAFSTIHSTVYGLRMAPRVVSVPTDLGASGDRLWVPDAGNTVQDQPPLWRGREPGNVCGGSRAPHSTSSSAQ